MTKPKLKLFVIKKYVMAKSASDALKKERKHKPDDCWVDADWRRNNPTQLESCIGFHVEHDYYSADEESNGRK